MSIAAAEPNPVSARRLTVERSGIPDGPLVMSVPVGEVRATRKAGAVSSAGPGPADDIALPDAAGALVVEFVAKLQARLAEHGVDALADFDVAEIADRMVALVPTNAQNEWDRLVGPFYDTAALSAWKGLSRQRLSVLRRERRLLGLRTADDVIVHPSFQFDADGGLLPHLAEVQAILEPDMGDEWTRALWLNTPFEAWGGRTAAEMLRSTADDISTVLDMAKQDAWSRRA